MITDDYQIWLTADSEREKIQLPVNPESIDIRKASKNEKIDIIGLGEIVIMQDRPAIEVSFSSFFPAAYFPGIKVEEITPPLALIEQIDRWMGSKQPVHLIITSSAVDMHCSIEDFRYSEEGGDVGTIHYDIELKEYRETAARQVSVDVGTQTATVEQTEQRVDNTAQPTTYTVKRGDCLYNISKKLYGKGSLWRTIYNANKDVIGSNPNLIYPGQILTIPNNE